MVTIKIGGESLDEDLHRIDSVIAVVGSGERVAVDVYGRFDLETAIRYARNLVRYAGMRRDRDWLQFDCALSYGLAEYLRTRTMLTAHDWSWWRVVPHGGHQMSLNIAAGLGLNNNGIASTYPSGSVV